MWLNSEHCVVVCIVIHIDVIIGICVVVGIAIPIDMIIGIVG